MAGCISHLLHDFGSSKRYPRMIVDFVYVIGILLALLIFGISSVRIFLGELDSAKIFIAVLTGLALTATCSSWLVAMSLDLVWLLPVLAFWASLSYMVMRLKGQKFRKVGIRKEFGSIKNFVIYLVAIFASGSTYILLQNNQLLKGRLAFRNGPDLVGWMSAAKYLCGQQNISLLASSIRSQLGVPDALMAFRDATKFPATSIYQIPSFTEQANGEFLIGAHRYGIPGLQAGVCRALGDGSLNRTAVALMAVSAILIATLATLVIKDFNMRIELKAVAIILCAVNVNIVSVTMEGGFGQLIATPFLLFFLVSAMKVEWRTQYLPMAIFLIISFAFSTYVDVLFAAAAFLSVFYIVQSNKRLFYRRRAPEWAAKAAFGSVCGLIVGWPLWTSIWRLVLERVKGAGALGGWDQGRIPFPSDFWSFFNWLPADGAHNIPRGLGLGIIEMFISLFILYAAVRSKEKVFKNFVMTSFVFYLVLLFIVYRSGIFHSNNYTIWKMSAYLSSLTILAIASIHNDKLPSNHGVLKIADPKNDSPVWVNYLLILALTSSVGWSVSWFGSRQFSFNPATPQEQAFFNEYDVQIVGFSGANTSKFALQGDIHFLEPSRAFQIQTKRSLPLRPLAYVVPSGSCQTIACVEAVIGPVRTEADQYLPRDNKIINGDFGSWKRGPSFTTSGVTADSWSWATGSAGIVTQEIFVPGSVPASGSDAPFYLRWNLSGNNQNYEIFQKIKDVRTLAGQTVVLSFWARETSGATTFQTRIFQNFGTGGSPSSLEQAGGGGSYSLTSSWKKFTQVFTIPSINGKTIGTSGDSFLEVSFQATSTETGQLDLWGVQLASRELRKIFASSEFNAYE